MKIAYVVTRADSVGGASIHVRDLAGAMMERGHEATVLAGGAGPLRDLLEREGVPFRSLRFLRRPVAPAKDLRALGELTAALRELRPDLVSAHTAKAGFLGRAAAKRAGVPVIYTPHGWSIEDRISPAQGVVYRRFERIAARWGDSVICVCEYERRLALKHRIAPAEKVHVVYNGVRDIPAELRAEPAREPVRIVSVARFAPPKDHATLLRALSMVRTLEWSLDLVGDGPDQPSIEELAHDLGVAARIRFLGYRSDPEAVLAGAQIFALATRSEAFPRSVLEAMRAGLPVVATDVGGVGEAVQDGENGLLTPRGDPGVLSTALAGLIRDAQLRKRLGERARLTYERRFGLRSFVAGTTKIYEAVLSGLAEK